MVAGKEVDLQRMMDRLNKTTTDYGMKNIKITIDREEIEQATEFCYFGSLISSDTKCHKEIKKRLFSPFQ